ncbi:MAG: site-specific DNA-methyltransferase [Candidatus Wallbacteria bacterium]|nr:site-specific DNA-methyltransferase [Candidatus Wallbacteria bacterium]
MIRLLTGSALDVLRGLPSESVHCAVTSPPYYRHRSYLPKHHPLKHLELGQEPTPDLFVGHLVEVFRELRRVLRSDGLFWLVIGDSRSNGPRRSESAGGTGDGWGTQHRDRLIADGQVHDHHSIPGFRRKELIGIPWMLAFALRSDGWYLRAENIWHKPAPMPESVQDRTTYAHEQIFMFSKRAHYYYDATAIREPYSDPRENKAGAAGGKTAMRGQAALRPRGNMDQSGTNIERYYGAGGRNKRTVWTVQPSPYKGKHCATFPAALIRPCIAAGTSERGCCPTCGAPWRRETSKKSRRGTDRKEGSRALVAFPGPPHRGLKNHETAVEVATIGWSPTCKCTPHEPVPCTVIDPFGGAGTTAIEAGRQLRDAILIDLDEASIEEARGRLVRELGLLAMFGEAAVA